MENFLYKRFDSRHERILPTLKEHKNSLTKTLCKMIVSDLDQLPQNAITVTTAHLLLRW